MSLFDKSDVHRMVRRHLVRLALADSVHITALCLEFGAVPILLRSQPRTNSRLRDRVMFRPVILTATDVMHILPLETAKHHLRLSQRRRHSITADAYTESSPSSPLLEEPDARSMFMFRIGSVTSSCSPLCVRLKLSAFIILCVVYPRICNIETSRL
jgi:hypothetical protein